MLPVLFQVPYAEVPVYAYGFMLGLALVVGWNLALYLAWRDGLSVPRVAWAVFGVLILAILGSRMLHVLVNPAEWAWPGSWFDLRGGIVAYGGFLGGTLGAYLFVGRGGVGFLRAADVLSPPVALGIVLTRIGCFLNGCDFGTPTGVPWAVRFPRESPAWREQLEAGVSFGGEAVTAASWWSLPVHPTQLYESALGLLLFAALILVWKRKRFYGAVFLALTAGYGLGRALIEVFRGDAQRGIVADLSTSQALGLGTAVVATIFALLHRPRRADAIA